MGMPRLVRTVSHVTMPAAKTPLAQSQATSAVHSVYSPSTTHLPDPAACHMRSLTPQMGSAKPSVRKVAWPRMETVRSVKSLTVSCAMVRRAFAPAVSLGSSPREIRRHVRLTALMVYSPQNLTQPSDHSARSVTTTANDAAVHPPTASTAIQTSEKTRTTSVCQWTGRSRVATSTT
jgi:hypothetical protein